MKTLEDVVAELRLVRTELTKIGADVGDVKAIMGDMMEGKRLQRKKDAERKRTKRERSSRPSAAVTNAYIKFVKTFVER